MSTIVLRNEKELLIQTADGYEPAYKELFSRYWDHIYSIAMMFTKCREMSQDLAQDVFAQIWIKRQHLREVKQFDDFLFIVARNLILDRLRKKVFTSAHTPRLVEHFNDPSLTPFEAVELKEMEEMINLGVNHLPRQQQTAFFLSRFQGLRHEEIALQMGISRQSVKSHIVRAISTLRKYMASRTALFLFFSLLFF